MGREMCETMRLSYARMTRRRRGKKRKRKRKGKGRARKRSQSRRTNQRMKGRLRLRPTGKEKAGQREENPQSAVTRKMVMSWKVWDQF